MVKLILRFFVAFVIATAVASAQNFPGPMRIGDDLDVFGNVDISGTLTLNTLSLVNLSLSGTLDVLGDSTFADIAVDGGNITSLGATLILDPFSGAGLVRATNDFEAVGNIFADGGTLGAGVGSSQQGILQLRAAATGNSGLGRFYRADNDDTYTDWGEFGGSGGKWWHRGRSGSNDWPDPQNWWEITDGAGVLADVRWQTGSGVNFRAQESVYFKEGTAGPDVVGDGQLFARISDSALVYREGDGTQHVLHGGGGSLVDLTKSYTFSARSATSGTYYIGGFYDSPLVDSNLTQASTTQTYGDANHPYAAHAFLVAGGAGSVDAGSCTIVVSGTSITSAGVRTGSDSETIVADITAMSIHEYFETSKKWLGTVTYTLTPSGASTYSADFNYGYVKYEDFGNSDFTVVGFEVTGLANANDSGFNIGLCHHKATGWTYDTTNFVAGTGLLIDMNTDYGTEQDLISGEQFAYKRLSISTAVSGSGSEGTIVQIVTSSNNSVSYLNCHLGITFD